MIEWKTLQDIMSDHAYTDLWNANMSSTKNLYAMYNSLEWLSCHDNQERQQIVVAVRGHDSEMARIGFATMARRLVPLYFMCSRTVDLSFKIMSLEMLGSEVICDQNYEFVSELVKDVWKTFPDVDSLYFKSVSNETKLWEALSANDWKIGNSLVYKPNGYRSFHYVVLPPNYEEYMASFSSKQRFSLKKKIRKMREVFPGTLEYRRITEPSDLYFLITSVQQVVKKSWRAEKLTIAEPLSIRNQPFLRNVAEKGLLRSYVLMANGTPCAFIIGYCFNGIYHYADLAYDADYYQYSPGTVLLLMIIKNLIEQDEVKFINFGITDAQYKQVFGNRHIKDAELFILRPSLSTKMQIGVHAAIRGAKAFAISRYKKR